MSARARASCWIAACGAALLAAGCATAGAGSAFHGGFSEERLDEDEFWIGFAGNLSVDAAALDQSLLRRAAEVTRRNGFSYFTVISRSRQSGLGVVLRLDRIGPLRRVERSLIIRCYSVAPDAPDAYDADQLLTPRDASI